LTFYLPLDGESFNNARLYMTLIHILFLLFLSTISVTLYKTEEYESILQLTHINCVMYELQTMFDYHFAIP